MTKALEPARTVFVVVVVVVFKLDPGIWKHQTKSQFLAVITQRTS